jgi:HNH endonuclease
MFQPGEIVSYHDMCGEEQTQLQRGMNFRLPSGRTVVLMSRRSDAPYADEMLDQGRTILYEGHDARRDDSASPKFIDQPRVFRSGRLTQNGLFELAAIEAQRGVRNPELVRVYEKIHAGIWAFNGTFALVSADLVDDGHRVVFRFRLELIDDAPDQEVPDATAATPHTRVIPSLVKRAVWARDRGKCVQCGAKDNLHFDHILPYSRGGASIIAENVQILCARHNLEKGARIE